MFKKLSICLTLGFCLAGVTMADETADSAEAPADAAAAMCQAAQPADTPHATSEPELSTQAYCLAHCVDSPDVDCPNGTTSCSAVDQVCPANTGGYVLCDGVRKNCGPCCTCHEGAECADDSYCDCGMGFGFCDKEPFEIGGTCSCYF